MPGSPPAAAGTPVNTFADVSAFPEGAQNFLGPWPDPETGLGLAVRFGAIAVILAYRYVGNVIKRAEQDDAQVNDLAASNV